MVWVLDFKVSVRPVRRRKRGQAKKTVHGTCILLWFEMKFEASENTQAVQTSAAQCCMQKKEAHGTISTGPSGVAFLTQDSGVICFLVLKLQSPEINMPGKNRVKVRINV